MAEPYWDERPGEGGTGGGAGGGGWGGGGGGGGGGGTGGGSGGGWGYGWGDKPGTKPGPEWGGDKPFNFPYLKRSSLTGGGYLLLGPDGRLLTGHLSCKIPPAAAIYVSGDEDHAHARCILCRLSDPLRTCTLKTGEGTEAARKAGLAATAYWSWAKPGRFTLSVKWQAGHWDHAKINRMGFVVYGIGLGWRTMALKSWLVVATIDITDTFEVYVNGIKGKLRGNAPLMEE